MGVVLPSDCLRCLSFDAVLSLSSFSEPPAPAIFLQYVTIFVLLVGPTPVLAQLASRSCLSLMISWIRVCFLVHFLVGDDVV